jgi:putative transposase
MQASMIVYEFKVKGKPYQYQAIDEAIRTGQFIRNSCLRYWMDNPGLGRKELYRYNTELRAMYPFAKDLNSHACQASVERCWSAIARFLKTVKGGATLRILNPLRNAHQERKFQVRKGFQDLKRTLVLLNINKVVGSF